MLRHLLFDLDETLYSPQTGLWPLIGERITQFIQDRLGVSPAEAQALRYRYARDYGVTLAGLLKHHAIDADDYLEYVHRLPLEDYLQPDLALNAMLARLPLPKTILTNADAAHAERVLNHLGIRRHFQRIIDVRALDFIYKPEPEAYRRALALLGAAAPECVFIDDLARNLTPAHDLGLVTILVRPPVEAGAPSPLGAPGPDGILPPGVDYHTPTVLGVERILAGLIGQV